MGHKARINFDAIEEYERVILEPGIYPAQIETKGQRREPTQSGHDAFIAVFHVYYPGRRQKTGVKISRKIPLAGPGLFMLKQVVRAAGLPAVGDYTFDTDMLHGKWVQVKIKHTERNERIYHDIEAVLPADADADEADTDGGAPDGTAPSAGSAVAEAIRQVRLKAAAG